MFSAHVPGKYSRNKFWYQFTMWTEQITMGPKKNLWIGSGWKVYIMIEVEKNIREDICSGLWKINNPCTVDIKILMMFP